MKHAKSRFKDFLIFLFSVLLCLTFVVYGCSSDGGGSSTGGDDTTGGDTDTGDGTDDGDGADGTDTDTVYRNQNLPDSFMVDIPQSLRDSSRSAARQETAGGYQMVKTFVDIIDESSLMMEIQFVMVDAFYDEVVAYLTENSTDTVPAGALQFTITQDIANRIAEVLQEAGLDSSYYGLEVGDTVSNPRITYTELSGSNYAYEIVFEEFEEDMGIESGEEESFVTTIRWNESRTHVLSRSEYESAFTYEGSTYRYEGGNTFIYDADSGTMTFICTEKDSAMELNLSVTLAEAGDNNGIDLECSGTERLGFEGMTFAATFDIAGFADDNGGYVEVELTMLDEEFPMDIQYRESFDGDGNLTGWAFYEDGDWIAMEGYGDPTESAYYDEDEEYGAGLEDVTVSGLSGEEEIVFVIVAGGGSPEDPEDQLGMGVYDGVDVDVDYWGEAGEMEDAEIYSIDYDQDGDLVYTELPDASVA